MAELPWLLVRVVFVVAALGLWQWAAHGIVAVMADWPAWDLEVRVRLVIASGWIVIVARATSCVLRAARVRRAAASVRVVGESRVGALVGPARARDLEGFARHEAAHAVASG